MRFDIVLVLYNNADWLAGCIESLAKIDSDPKDLYLYLIDNASSDDMQEAYSRLEARYPVFGGFTYHRNARNKGFGAACNDGAALGNAPWLFFLNVDTRVEPDCFAAIRQGIEANPGAGAFECRQLPREMSHVIDPVTLETPWASGAALLVRRDVFELTGGFDPHIFMYCEDVDLSWRIRGAGYPIIYLPAAVVNHYILGRGEASLNEYAGSAFGRLLLAYKYGGVGLVLAENRRFLRQLRNPQHFNGVRRRLAKDYLRHFVKLWPFLFWRFRNRSLFTCIPYCFEETFAPDRGCEVLETRIVEGPLFSVVVRTCKRPDILRGALTSLRHQTYRNFEIVVVEDGPQTSLQMIEQEFSDLPLRYFSTGKNIGRGGAGNYGLAQARGEYLNFLDDDDYLYPDHLELMAAKALMHPEADLILGCAMAMKVEVEGRQPYRVAVKSLERMLFSRVDKFTMSQTCQIPIQSACFRRSLFERCGGLKEGVEANEDWAMWVRYIQEGRRIDNKHVDIHRATSAFVLPADKSEQKARLEKYQVYDAAFYADPDLRFEVTLQDMRDYYDDMLADIRHLKALGKLDEYLAEQDIHRKKYGG